MGVGHGHGHAELDLDDVVHHLSHAPGVVGVHDLHAWTITTGMTSLSAHVTVTDEAHEDLVRCTEEPGGAAIVGPPIFGLPS